MWRPAIMRHCRRLVSNTGPARSEPAGGGRWAGHGCQLSPHSPPLRRRRSAGVNWAENKRSRSSSLGRSEEPLVGWNCRSVSRVDREVSPHHRPCPLPVTEAGMWVVNSLRQAESDEFGSSAVTRRIQAAMSAYAARRLSPAVSECKLYMW